MTCNMLSKFILFFHFLLHKIPKFGPPKKGYSRFVGGFSFWTFLKNRKMSILQKRLPKFVKKRA